MLYLFILLSCFSWISPSLTSVIRSGEIGLPNYAKVARWGPSSTSTNNSPTQNVKGNYESALNHRSNDNQRKLNFATNNKGVTYYYSKDIPRVDEKSDHLPETGEVMQNPENHKPYFSYIYKPETYANAKIDVSDEFKPPLVSQGSVTDYSNYNFNKTSSQNNYDLYNSPYTSYNPPESPKPSGHDFLQYPPNDKPPPVFPKVPLSELYSSQDHSDDDTNIPDDAIVDSYNTPKPPKGSKPKPPAPIYGPPPPPPPPQFSAPKPEKPPKANMYKFPEPFPVPQVFDANDHKPPTASYGVPVTDGSFDPPAAKKPKEKKKPVKQVETYKPPFEIGNEEPSHDIEDDDRKHSFSSVPRPFHPPLAIAEDDDNDYNPKDHHKGKDSFLSPPPADEGDDEGGKDTEDDYVNHYPKPSKPKAKKPSHGTKNYYSHPGDDSDDSPPSSKVPQPPPDTEYPSHGHSLDFMKYPPPPMDDMSKPPQGPPPASMAEDDLSPPPSDGGKHPYFSDDEYEHGNQFNYEPYDYDHHVYHEVKTTTTPAPSDHRANYSYYFLGRKLWYVPLYFSIYFIIYVTVLIIKSIARHKVQLVNNFDQTTVRAGRELSDLNYVYSNISSTLESANKKFM